MFPIGFSAHVESDRVNTGGSFRTIVFWIIHPKYDSQTTDYDVSLARALFGFFQNGVTVRPARLVDAGAELPAGEMVTVTGWGQTSVRTKLMSNAKRILI